MRRVPIVVAILVMLLNGGGGLQARPKAAPPAKPGGVNRLGDWVTLTATGKKLDTTSKVKGVFKKAARTVTLECELLNRGKMEVRAVRGSLKFTTYFGDPIGELVVELVNPLPPGQKVPTSWKIKRERFASDDAFKKFTDTPLDKMRVVWVPTVVVLADGTQLKP